MVYLMQIFREESDIIGTASSLYIRLLESNGLIQTSNGVATLVKHFHQNQYQTLSIVNFGDGSVVLLIES